MGRQKPLLTGVIRQREGGRMGEIGGHGLAWVCIPESPQPEGACPPGLLVTWRRGWWPRFQACSCQHPTAAQEAGTRSYQSDRPPPACS